MKKIILISTLFLSAQAFAGEYQKMFSCARSLKEEAQISGDGVTKDYVVIPSKMATSEGVNVFTSDTIYFCKLPKKAVSRDVDEKKYKMNIALAKQKSIFLAYTRSPSEASIEMLGGDENLDFAFNRAELQSIKPTPCTSTKSDPHAEKILADFLRKQIAQVHERHESQSLESPGAEISLKTCQKSFLLKSIAENELRKFETRVPASAE